MICRICGSIIERSEFINKLNVDVNGIYTVPRKSNRCDMEYYYCSQCGHGQIRNILSCDHYKEYNLLNLDKDKKLSGGRQHRTANGAL